MNPQETLLLEIATRIADHQLVDWEALLRERPEQRELIANLQLIAQLGQDSQETLEDGELYVEPATFTWGHLQVQDQIGSGGFGDVYRAFDPILQREVALKLRRAEASGSGAARLFIEEARRLARVRHPNVLAVHGADLHDDRVGLWADLLRGETLEARITQAAPLPAAEVLELGLAIARALAAVHAAELVHGDVKAANVMLEADGRVVLMDFGAGSDLRTQDDDEGSGPRFGSPLSMAPELLSGSTPGPAGDLYAFGVLLFRLLTGEHPVEATTWSELLELHQRGERRPWRPPAGTPRALRQLVDALLSPRPELRPTAAQARDRLLAILAAPAKKRQRLALAAIVGSLALGAALSTIGYLRAVRSEVAAVAAHHEAEAVNDFLTDLLMSPRLSAQGPQIRVAEVLDRAAAKAERDLTKAPGVQIKIFSLLGDTEVELNRFDRAERYLERALALWIQHPGQDPGIRLDIRCELGNLYEQQVRTEEAKRLLTAVIAEADAMAPDNRNRVLARIYRARAAADLTDFAAAERDLEEALALRAAGQAESDLQLAAIELTQLQAQRGQFQAAEAGMREALRWYEANEGEHHSNTLLVRQDLAAVLARTGRPAEAEKLIRHNLEVADVWLGEDSRFHIANWILLDDVLWAQGRRDEPLTIHRKLLAAALRTAGTTSEMYIVALGNYATRLKELGQHEAAEPILRQAIELAEQHLRPGYEVTSIYRYNLAELLYQTGRPQAALLLAETNRQALLGSLGQDHLFTLVTEALKGACQVALGQRAAGEELLKTTLERQQRILGADHPNTLETQVYLARAWYTGQRPQDGVALLAEGLERRRRVLGVEHPLTQESERELAAWRLGSNALTVAKASDPELHGQR